MYKCAECLKPELDFLKEQYYHHCCSTYTYVIYFLKYIVFGNKMKFADDGTIWRTGKDVSILLQMVETAFEKVQEWGSLWRMKISFDKEQNRIEYFFIVEYIVTV